MTTVSITDGLRYGFRFLGVLLALVLVCGAAVAGGGAVAWTGFDAANPVNSQILYVAAGGLVALVGALALLGVTVGLLYKFVTDSIAAGIEAATPEGSTAPVDGVVETTVDGSDSPSDTSADVDAVPGDDGTVDDTAVEADADPDTGETAPDPAGGEVTPETAETRARDVLEDSADTAAGSASGRAETDVTARGESTAGGAETGADDTSGGAVSGPSAEEPRETMTAADEWQSGDEIRATDGASTDDPDRSEGPRGEELDRLVSEATDPDGGPDAAADSGVRSPAGEPVSDTADGAVPATDSGSTEAEPLPETDAPPAPDAESEGAAGGSEPTDDGHGGASPGGEEFESAFEDVEDTTDEPGDWKPLDEEDL